MTTCETLAPLLVSRPLGLLEPEGEARVAAHLPGCGRCEGFAREVERALDAASLPVVDAGDPARDPPGWAELSARLTARPAPRRWPPAAGLLLVGVVVGAAALWPSPPAPPAPAPPPAAPAPPPPASEVPPASEASPPPLRAPQSSEPPRPASEPAGPFTDIDGRVVAIEREDEVRVRLSVGVDDGVQPGQRFAITRGGVLVGEVVVESVRGDSCSCRVVSLQPDGGYQIRPGDASGLPPH